MTGQEPVITKNKNMDTLDILLATIGAASVVGLAWVSGYRLGMTSGIAGERQLADRRIAGVLAAENARKPRRTVQRKRRSAK